MKGLLINSIETKEKHSENKIEILTSEYRKLKEISKRYSELKRDYNNLLNANVKLSDELRLIKMDKEIIKKEEKE